MSFGARPFILCGLPIRRVAPGILTYTRRNARFLLAIVGHPNSAFLSARISWCCFGWRQKQSEDEVPTYSLKALLRFSTTGGPTNGEYYRRLAGAFKRVFANTISFRTSDERCRSGLEGSVTCTYGTCWTNDRAASAAGKLSLTSRKTSMGRRRGSGILSRKPRQFVKCRGKLNAPGCLKNGRENCTLPTARVSDTCRRIPGCRNNFIEGFLNPDGIVIIEVSDQAQ
jgi:hypothetical protein